MLERHGDGLTVDFLLAGYRLFGVTYEVNEKVRLGDLLNGIAESITLHHASILGLRGQVLASLPEVTVEKRHLVAAIPKESPEYQQRQRLYRAGMVRPNLVRRPIVAVIPPFAATGKVHTPLNADLSDPEHMGLARFFPLTDACLYQGEERVFEGPIALLNRDLIAVIGKTGEELRSSPAFQASDVPTEELAKAVSALNQVIAPEARSLETSPAL
jgi:hypothetical protein